MTWPLIILAVCSIFSGWTIWLGLPIGAPVLEHMIEYGEPYRAVDIQAQHHYGAMAASALILLVGIGAGLLYYAPKGFPYFVPDPIECSPHRRATGRALPLPGAQVVLRRALLGRVRPPVPLHRAVLPADRQDPDRRPGRRLGTASPPCSASSRASST